MILAACHGGRLGIPATGPIQYHDAIDEALRLNPQYVIIAAYLGNDLLDAFRYTYTEPVASALPDPQMAEKMLAEIVDEIRQRWSLEDVAVAHRLGRLEIGETSLVVAVASPHRGDAFAACQHAVDRIKQMVPIWKKEFFEGGEVWVGSQEHSLPGLETEATSSGV